MLVDVGFARSTGPCLKIIEQGLVAECLARVDDVRVTRKRSCDFCAAHLPVREHADRPLPSEDPIGVRATHREAGRGSNRNIIFQRDGRNILDYIWKYKSCKLEIKILVSEHTTKV